MFVGHMMGAKLDMDGSDQPSARLQAEEQNS